MRACLLLPVLFVAAPAAATGCEQLRELQLPNVEIRSAHSIAKGESPPWSRPDLVMPTDMAYCEVQATARPTPDSDIRFELWIPAGTAWNGRFLQVGNGGFAGHIPYGTMLLGLAKGYAVAGTDDGHQTVSDERWALGHPEKITDFGWRAVKSTTDGAKAILAAYGTKPSRSYFFGCSDGGREALMTAQRFPADFDGIVAGAPAWAWTQLLGSAGRFAHGTTVDPAAALPPAKLPALQAAALRACGGGRLYIADPRGCRFDPGVLACTGTETDQCLTAAQLKTVRLVYNGTRDPGSGIELPGLRPGAEALDHSWRDWGIASMPGDPSRAGTKGLAWNYFAYLVKGDPDFRIADLTDADVVTGERKLAATLDAASPDLSAFKARGGKLIQYHGWNDPAIPPGYSLDYYGRVQARMGPSSDFYRLFMVPGMLHCSGGAAPTRVDWIAMLEGWVERGDAPAAATARDAAGVEQVVAAER